jgi:hypothetical protein
MQAEIRDGAKRWGKVRRKRDTAQAAWRRCWHDHHMSANGAGEGIRTLDPNLGNSPEAFFRGFRKLRYYTIKYYF